MDSIHTVCVPIDQNCSRDRMKSRGGSRSKNQAGNLFDIEVSDNSSQVVTPHMSISNNREPKFSPIARFENRN